LRTQQKIIIKYWFVLLFLSISFFSKLAYADLVQSTTIRYYDISGTKVDDLRNQINSRFAKYYGGDAFTQWQVKWSFRWVRRGLSCEIRDVAVDVNATMTLPRWVNYEKAPRVLQSMWDVYIQELTEHENIHLAYAGQTAQAIERLLSTMDGRDSCRELKKDANKRAYARLKQTIKKERHFDYIAHHDMKHGALVAKLDKSEF
jgi:predicted secreted Zn-dependent protease